MGRTLPTFVQLLGMEEASWRSYRRALRRGDQEAFDQLWRFARYYTAPASMISRPFPFESVTMGMMVGMMQEIRRLLRRVESLEQRLGRAEAQRDDLSGMGIRR